MKRELYDILCCPVCKGDLEAEVTEENDIEIITGSLICNACWLRTRLKTGSRTCFPQNI